ncbi:MAG: hypothetical protein R6W78_16515, partial [Bacteroidales bacterium]
MKNKALNYTLMLVTLFYLLPVNISAQKDRSEIADKYKWDLTPLFATKGFDKCLFVYAQPEWEKIKAKLDSVPFTGTD